MPEFKPSKWDWVDTRHWMRNLTKNYLESGNNTYAGANRCEEPTPYSWRVSPEELDSILPVSRALTIKGKTEHKN